MKSFVYVKTAEFDHFFINPHNVVRVYLDTPDDEYAWVTVDFLDQTQQSYPFKDSKHAVEFIENLTGNHNYHNEDD